MPRTRKATMPAPEPAAEPAPAPERTGPEIDRWSLQADAPKRRKPALDDRPPDLPGQTYMFWL